MARVPSGHKKIIAEDSDMWGDLERRHFSLHAEGKRLTKISADFVPSTALAKVLAFPPLSSSFLLFSPLCS